MCSNFYPTTAADRLRLFNISISADWNSPIDKLHVFNHYPAPIIRLNPTDSEEENQLLTAEFGLLPAWSKERKIKFATMNARSETVATKPTYRSAWKQGQKCIIPTDIVVEPDWRSGKHVPANIVRTDGNPMGIAGLWDVWTDKATGEVVFSFTMLTVNADDHSFMNQFHKPDDEKRMVVILPDDRYQDWLNAPTECNGEFLKQYPADELMLRN